MSAKSKILSINTFFKDKKRNALVFSQIINAVIGILIGKIISVYFLPEQFGEFNIQFATYTFFFMLFMNPFLQFMKNYTMKDLLSEGHTNVLRLLLILVFFCGLALVIIFRIKHQISLGIALVVLVTLPINIFYNLFTDYFNVKGELVLFSWSNIFKSFFSLLFVFLVIKYVNINKNGVFILWLLQIVGFLFGIIFFIKNYKWIFLKETGTKFFAFGKKYFAYSWPLMILAFWGWMNSFVDRYVIEYYMQIKAVGIYNANLGLGSKVFILINPMFLALMTPVVFNVETIDSEKKRIIRRYSLFYGIMSLMALLVLFFAYPFIGRLLLSVQYEDGFYIIFYSAFAYFIITITYLYELYFYVHNKTNIILISNILAAVANLLLNLVLIPKFGLSGAVTSLILSSSAKFVYTILVFKKI